MKTVREIVFSYPEDAFFHFFQDEIADLLESREVLVRSEAFAEGFREGERAAAEPKHLSIKYRDGAPPLVPWIRGYRRYTKCALFEAHDAYNKEFGVSVN